MTRLQLLSQEGVEAIVNGPNFAYVSVENLEKFKTLCKLAIELGFDYEGIEIVDGGFYPTFAIDNDI